METNQSQYEKMCEVYERYNKGDLVPVVRCKDCKWWNTDKIHKCVAYDAFWITDADDYCAWGERKNGQ